LMLKLQTTGSSTNQRILPDQANEVKLIKDKLNGFLMSGNEIFPESNPPGGDRPATGNEISEQPNPPQLPIRIAISSGHSAGFWGAYNKDTGLYEHLEAVKVVDRVTEILRDREVLVEVFHDKMNRDPDTNVNRIIAWHNNNIDEQGNLHPRIRDLDVSIHFNSFTVPTTINSNGVWFEPIKTERDINVTRNRMGCEVLYRLRNDITQQIATHVSRAIHEASSDMSAERWHNRGAKPRPHPSWQRPEDPDGPLGFLENEHARNPILIEVCFVNSRADVAIYRDRFEQICTAIADSLTMAVRNIIRV
ncbi:MAG: N-acetylmuramoyl-L-alanine amidase, partial [Spirochaetaceae bacterium]|nr:N-acetylmuramoyl-L-alanine amidase [Spirochaetaceae bacterium]